MKMVTTEQFETLVASAAELDRLRMRAGDAVVALYSLAKMQTEDEARLLLERVAAAIPTPYPATVGSITHDVMTGKLATPDETILGSDSEGGEPA